MLGIIFLTVPMLLVSSAARATADVHVNLIPRFLLADEYTDNYFSSARDKVPVWTTLAGAGLDLEALTDRSKVKLNYDIGHYFYRGNDADFDASSLDYTAHNFGLQAETRQFSRLVFGLETTYFLTREPSSSDAYSNATDPSKYWRNRVQPFVIYDVSEKGQVRLGYRNEVLNYLEPQVQHADSTENRGLLTLTYHLNDTNHLDLANQYWARTYSGSTALSNYDSWQSELVLRHEFNSYFTGEAGAGYQYREFSDPAIDSIGSPVFHLGVQGASDRTRLECNLGYNLNDFTQGNEYFKALRADLFFQRLFLERIRLYLGGYYQYSDYQATPRQDNAWDAFSGLGYRFFHDRLELSIEYRHRDRGSSESGFDYTDNRVTGRLTASYEINRETGR